MNVFKETLTPAFIFDSTSKYYQVLFSFIQSIIIWVSPSLFDRTLSRQIYVLHDVIELLLCMLSIM